MSEMGKAFPIDNIVVNTGLTAMLLVLVLVITYDKIEKHVTNILKT